MRTPAPLSICSVLYLLLLSSLISFQFSAATDTITVSQSIGDGETLVSSDGTYELGFFSPGSSRNRYVGLWYRNLPVRTYIWVANREVPIANTTGVVLRVREPGILVLLNDTNGIIWSSNTSRRSVQNPVAQLLDSGNLVVRDANDDRPENFLWQSFDHPTDTYWAAMRIGWNLVTGLETHFWSWRSADDPAPGDYNWGMDLTGFPQIFFRRGADIVYRIGPWDGFRFSGTRDDPTYKLSFVMNENEVYYRSVVNTTIISKFTVNQSGQAQRLTWVDQRGWVAYLSLPADVCDAYGLCSEYGRCDVGNSPSCSCLQRFVPRDPDGWLRGDWTKGCVRMSNLSCEGDVFLRYSGIKLPDARNSRYNLSMTIEECEAGCLRNCACMAYTQLDTRRAIGCLMWYGNLSDIRSLSAQGQDIYIRMASSEADSSGRKSKSLIVILTLVLGMALVVLGLVLFIWKRTKKNQLTTEEVERKKSHTEDLELPTFDLLTITEATNSFSFSFKLGEGGFGPVYKGKLEDGKEIAVKRLSGTSMQGLVEFKNEVICIAKLQHRNLVKLLGCCIQGEEKMLIYEYMPNKSLDLILFDQTKSKMLDWTKRIHIINGIAKGLLYLHHDSRLRIIHRDLKASNILLDLDMNPKISDFGMARIFGGNETEANTSRVVGTYGYMSPEYAVDGLFSIKSDVYSFGVLVLEIVSGKRNRGFHHKDHYHNLLGHAWMLYKDGRSFEIVDDSLGDSLDLTEMLRSVHVALLCVQKHQEDRPNMSQVVFMLGGESTLPEAKEPGFFTERDVYIPDKSMSTNTGYSSNRVTITLLDPR